VVKHASAASALVTLTYAPESVRVKVSDDGIGFDPAGVGKGERTSWGLRNMEERAALLGGAFEVRSGSDRGTVVEVTLPDAAHDGGSA
jgi:NarL family two-component system sensor histidine kinase LiaS